MNIWYTYCNQFAKISNTLHLRSEQKSSYNNYYKQVNKKEAVVFHQVKTFCYIDTVTQFTGHIYKK